ncbi:hypothetical protein ACLMJK_001307 [Lecanora helva]
MGIVLSCMEADKRRKQRKMAEFAKTKRGQRMMKSKRMVKYKEKRLKAMQPEVERRLREEKDHSKGQQVWFSRYINNGRLRHWVLMTHGNKYELRRTENVQRQTGEERAGEQEFTYHVSPFTVDEEKRQAALAESSLPEVDGFYVCLIGWTTKSKEEVDSACRSVLQQFGKYNLLWKNCQDFLRMLAEQIIASKAADYSWFNSNTKTRYQKTQSLMPPPLELLMRMQQQMNAAMQGQIQTQNQIQLQMQNQIQLQMQLQIQNQIQMQMQNQMQMQMQNSAAMGGG